VRDSLAQIAFQAGLTPDLGAAFDHNHNRNPNPNRLITKSEEIMIAISLKAKILACIGAMNLI
jgi:hypothetical protein